MSKFNKMLAYPLKNGGHNIRVHSALSSTMFKERYPIPKLYMDGLHTVCWVSDVGGTCCHGYHCQSKFAMWLQLNINIVVFYLATYILLVSVICAIGFLCLVVF